MDSTIKSLHDQSRIRESNTGLFIDMISSIGILSIMFEAFIDISDVR